MNCSNRRLWFWVLMASLLLGTPRVMAQTQHLFEDKEGVRLADEIITDFYNHKMEEGRAKIEVLKNKGYNNHASVPLLEALGLFIEMMFEMENREIGVEFEQYLRTTCDRAQLLLDANPEDEEGVFFALFGHAYLSFYFSENGQMPKAVGEAKKAYTYMKKGFDLEEKNGEFYVSSGLYLFYAIQYPETRPIVKPVMSFFPDGDKEKGIRYLKLAIEESVFGRPVALQYVQHILMKYEEQYEASLPFAYQMVEMYPDNMQFKAKLAENLLWLERYEEAKPIINELKERPEEFFKMMGLTLNGIYYERYRENFKVARTNYRLAKEIGLKNTNMSYDYLGFCYYGFARMLEKEENLALAKKYYKYSLDYTEYPFVRRDCRAFIKKY